MVVDLGSGRAVRLTSERDICNLLRVDSSVDDMAYIVWRAETVDNVYELATDTFVVANGKICSTL